MTQMLPAKGERILSLDLMRGYFLLVILLDHLFRFPSVFEFFTGRGQLWVSAAEGFFIISGLLIGYLYGPKMATAFKHILLKIWKRAAKLYFCSIGLTILFTVWGHFLPGNAIKSGIWTGGGSGELVWKILTLQYVYGWADFVAYYVVFLLFAPLALWLITKTGGWAVIAISLMIWVVRGESFYRAWQVLFMSGLVAGYYLPRFEKWFAELEHRRRTGIRIALTRTTLFTIVLSVLFVFGVGYEDTGAGFLVKVFPQAAGILTILEHFDDQLRPWFDKNTLALGRLALAWLWFTTLYVLIRPYEKIIDRLSVGLFRTLGQHSLLVYGLEAVVLFPINVIVPGPYGFIGNTLVGASATTAVYLIVVSYKPLLRFFRPLNFATLLFRPLSPEPAGTLD